MTERTFDRVPGLDPRNRDYPIRTLLGPKPPRSYTWSCGTWLDQGSEGACVGHAWAHEAAARPVVRPADSALAFGLYRRAQQLDPWPGEDYSGTSVLAGAKAAREKGLLTEFRWAFGLDDLLSAVSRHGPVVLGVNWYEGMFDTTNGFLSVSGRLAGGHAILATGVRLRDESVLLHNSWGQGWGVNGKARIRFADLQTLLSQDGDVCVPVVRG